MSDLPLRWTGPPESTGNSLGHYRLLEAVGEGGMGRVYKALDTKLGRTVALKILRPELLRDREKVRRFRREAKATSTLNHPAIVTVLDVGEAAAATTAGEPVDFIVMEYVEGESLRQWLRRRLSLPKRLELVARIAEGMAVAHAAGVIHRDLKPDNIIVTPDGQPKIVDFGLAKLTQPEIAADPGDPDAKTLTLQASVEGVVLGTAGYMSPEQVEGRPVDHRTDVFALGCILYEVVAGQRAFTSDSLVGTLHKILYAEPEPLRQRDPSLPSRLEHIVRRCLAKDPEERYQSIKEVAIELRSLLADKTAAGEVGARPLRWRRWLLGTAALLGVAAVAVWVGSQLVSGTDLERYRFTPFATDSAYEGFPAWSPDGRAIAYVRDVDGILQIFVRSLDSPGAAQITRAARDCREPFWHPRGDRIFYISQAGEGDALWSVGTGGGSAEVVLADVSSADISPDGQALVFLRQTSGHGSFRSSLWISSPPGAEPVQGSRGELAKYNLALPGYVRFSPDGSKIGLWCDYNPANPLAESGPSDLTQTGFWILPYPQGEPYRVALSSDVEPFTFRFTWMDDNRHIVFGGELPKAEGTHLWIMDTTNAVIRPLTIGQASESDPAVGPDGRIAFSSERGDYDLMAVDLATGSLRSYASTTRLERSPASSPVRPEIAYVTNRSGRQEVWLRSEDGTWERPVVSGKDFDDPTLLLGNLAFSPDGQRVAYQRRSPKGYHVWISPIAGGAPVRIFPAAGYQDNPTWSPDGDWMAFVVTMREGFALLKVRVGAGTAPVTIKDPIVYPSVPQWSPRGDWITVDTPDGFAITSPDGSNTRLLVEASVAAHTWSRDGSAIYVIQISDDLHLLLSKIDVDTGDETHLGDLGLAPPVIDPIAGLTLAPDGKQLLMGLRRLEGDLWLLDGFAPPRRRFRTRR